MKYRGILLVFDEESNDSQFIGLRIWLMETLFGGEAHLITQEDIEEWEEQNN